MVASETFSRAHGIFHELPKLSFFPQEVAGTVPRITSATEKLTEGAGVPVQVLSLFQNFGDATTANLLRPCSGCEHHIDTLLENVGYVDDNVFPLHTRSGHSAETTLCPELSTMALFALPTLMSQWLGIIRQNSSLVRHHRTCGACNSLPPLQRRAHPVRHSPAATNGVAGRTR